MSNPRLDMSEGAPLRESRGEQDHEHRDTQNKRSVKKNAAYANGGKRDKKPFKAPQGHNAIT
jgi:hypothetical protein